MLEVHFATWVLDVEIAAVLENVGGGDFPCSVILFSFLPPGDTVGKFFELNRLCLREVLPAFGQGLLVVPDIFGGPRAVEEQEIGWDAGVGREDTVGQSHNRMEIEILQQFFLDAGADAVAEEGAVGNDDRCSAASRVLRFEIAHFRIGAGAAELAHNELEKEQRGFRGLLVFRKVGEDAALFFSAEGRIRQNNIHAISIADLL